MARTVKDMLAEANAAVPKLAAEAAERMRSGDVLVVDVPAIPARSSRAASCRAR